MSKGIIANSVMNAAGGMLLLLAGFFCSILTARLLGPEDNGIIAFSLWLCTTGAAIAELGSGITMARLLPQLEVQGYSARQRRGFAAILLLLMLASTLVLLGLYTAVFLTSEELHWAKTSPQVAILTGILFAVQSVGSFAKLYLIGERRLVDFFKLTVAASTVQMIGVGIGAWYDGVTGALIGYIAGQIVMLVATLPTFFVRRDKCGVALGTLTISSMVLVGQYLIDSVFLNRIELLYLQQFWSVEMVSYYAIGLSISNIALQLPIQLTGSILPYYSERRHQSADGTLPVEVFSSVTRAMGYLVLPMSLGLAAISNELVETVFGPAFRPAGPIVAVLALTAPASTFMQTLGIYLLSMERERDRLKTGIAGAAVMILGCLILVPFFAGVGAALVRVLAFASMALILLKFTRLNAKLGGLYRDLARTLAAAIACALAAYTTVTTLQGPLGLCAGIVAGGLIYFLCLRLLRVLPQEDIEVLNSIVSRVSPILRGPLSTTVRFIAPEKVQSSIAADPDKNETCKAAIPVVVDGTIGLFKDTEGSLVQRDIAVLFLSAWGFEEMCGRKLLRNAAEHLSTIGVPSLRFDYRGTGDALDFEEGAAAWEVWEQNVLEAANLLRKRSGRRKIVLVVQSIGAILAERMAPVIGGVEAIVMIAPALNGRSYLREVKMWSNIVEADLGVADDRPNVVSIAGLTMPKEIEARLRAFNLSAPEKAAAPQYLILEQPGRADDMSLATALKQSGAIVEQDEFPDYEKASRNPLIGKVPEAGLRRMTDWFEATFPVTSFTAMAADGEGPQRLTGHGFEELPLRFGAHQHLIAVLTRPTGPQTGDPVIFLGASNERHAGWGRTNVTMARELAQRGIPSLRFDVSSIGDSAAAADGPDQIIYSAMQLKDARAALDLLEDHVPGRPVGVGRCSGGYLAIQLGYVDPRIKAVVAANPAVYYWDPSRKLSEDFDRTIPRSIEDYGQRLMSFNTVKRLLRGEINVKAAICNLFIACWRRMSFRFSPLVRMLPKSGKSARQVHSIFSTLQTRKTRLIMLYSERDIGLDEMYFHFGPGGRNLSRYGNVDLVMLSNADHNLTQAAARRAFLDNVIKAVESSQTIKPADQAA
ncbi:oligosaccharide flippase family protein [Oryzifoliimicrobium ureilyticus]|uniref:oligosaccharide flippase family protein n=1 Tax=Oryzifoliimicrobium ureilyticus TaxID=3113724 RepID=UPI0030767DA6